MRECAGSSVLRTGRGGGGPLGLKKLRRRRCCAWWGGKYASVQAAGGAVSVEKGVELTSVRAADGGQVRAFGGHTLKLGQGRSEFTGVELWSAGGDVDEWLVCPVRARSVCSAEAAALRALNGSEGARRAWLRVRRRSHGEEHVGGDADVDELVGLLAEYSELEAALEQGGVVKPCGRRSSAAERVRER